MKNEYNIVSLDSNYLLFWNLFSKLKSRYSYISSLYCEEFYSHIKIKAADEGYAIKEFSTLLCFNDIPFFGFLGAEFKKKSHSNLSCYFMPALSLDSPDITYKQVKKVEDFIKQIIEKYNPRFSITGADCTTSSSVMHEYLLSNFNSSIKLSPVRIIDLKLSESILKRSLRKSYSSLINWGVREMEIEIFDSKNITWEVIISFYELHIKVAGRKTRSIETWKEQYKAILSGNAFCITAKLNSELVSAVLFLCSDKHSYYWSSASRRDLFDKPISHCLIWQALLKAKEMGAVVLEIGTADIPFFDSCPSDKEKSIAYFKKGFGGRLKFNLSTQNYP